MKEFLYTKSLAQLRHDQNIEYCKASRLSTNLSVVTLLLVTLTSRTPVR